MFTDVSFCSETNIGAYAVWAKAEGRTLRYASMFKRPVQNVNVAEAYALINGVVITLRSIKPGPGSKIIAQTDSLNAISALTKRIRLAAYSGLAEMMVTKLAEYNTRIEYRHVTAHHGTQTPRHAVNTWCDKECRRLLRGARNAQNAP
jgi:ribonuclease HI